MNDKILIVANPVAGKGKVKKDVRIIKKNFEDSGYQVITKYTTKNVNAEEIVKSEIDDKDIVVAVGGDGTLNEVVNGVTKSNKKVRIGFIPLGTTNDFARTLKVPTNKYKLSQNIDKTKNIECDTGSFNGKCFNYVSAFGVFAQTSCNTDRKEKNRFGRLAYLRKGTEDFFKINESYHLKITTDNEVIEDDFEYGSISNSKYMGGFQLFKEDEVKVNDGKFEVLLIKKTRNKAALLGTYAKLIMQIRDENVIYLRTSKLNIETTEKIKWSLDGESETSTGPVEIKNLNKNISIITM
ncbi:MAG: diacylglycerol kinase family lipid kinase [Clostridia bacterium]|nr:diacylglycerol kinase family lipid kinase [Clostridia bacterium]